MLLGKAGGAEALSVARAFLADMGQRFAIDSGFYTPFGSGDEGVEWLLDQPQWLADQMIPAHEQAFTMRQILALFDEHSLRFTKWLGMPVELDRFTARTELLERFAALPPRERLVALDLLIKPAYYFVAARRIAALE